MRNLACHDASEYFVKLSFADEKRIVLVRDFSFLLMEVQGHTVAQFYDEERTKLSRRLETENLSEKAGRFLLVPAPNNRVV